MGMQFEGVPDADEQEESLELADLEDEPLIYTVTDVADSQVVLDGNHPLAGMSLRFWVQVEDIRAATDEEIENRHPKGSNDEDDGDDSDDDFIGGLAPSGGPSPTLH